MEYTVEICCGSYYDALNVAKGGAKRIELNSALHLGGLTPSLASLILTKQNTDLKVIAMARTRGAGFCYSDVDYETMLLDIKLMLDNGVDGIAFGILDEAGNVDFERCLKIVRLIKSYGAEKEAVFHRAFDCVSDPYATIEQLCSLGINRVLTSGLQNKAIDGLDLIADLQKKYGDKIEILAGSGVNARNALEILEKTGISQIHSSCKNWLSDSTTIMNNVSYSYNGKNEYDVVDEELVAELVNTVNQNKKPALLAYSRDLKSK